jgi:hypothetical protein
VLDVAQYFQEEYIEPQSGYKPSGSTPAVVCVMGAGEERRTVDLHAPSGPELLLWPTWMLRVMPADSKSEVPISHTISTGDS